MPTWKSIPYQTHKNHILSPSSELNSLLERTIKDLIRTNIEGKGNEWDENLNLI